MADSTMLHPALQNAGITAITDPESGSISAVYFCICVHTCVCRLPQGHRHCPCTQQDVLIRQIGDSTDHHVCEVVIDLNRITSTYGTGAAQDCPHILQHEAE